LLKCFSIILTLAPIFLASVCLSHWAGQCCHRCFEVKTKCAFVPCQRLPSLTNWLSVLVMW
jgi:hypothetical protein